jgi:regulatory protein
MTDSPEDEAFEKACGYLSYRQRTEQEILRYLDKRGYGDVRDEVVSRLTRAGLINDRVFAETWVSERAGDRGYGRRRLMNELLRLGVDKTLVAEVIEAKYPEEQEESRALSIASRQWPRVSGKTPRDRGRKLYSFLLRRGFDMQASKEAVEALIRSNDQEE